jgi:phage gp36-like protein
MAYCTQADIEKLIPTTSLAQLTTESGYIPDVDVVAEVIAQADAEIDSYCGKQYSVPFSPVPARIRTLSVDISIYRFYLRRQIVPDPARQRYEDAIAFLKDIARGLAVIDDGGTVPDPTATGTNSVTFSSNTRVFTRDEMYDL